MKSVVLIIFLLVIVLFASSYIFESKKRLLLNGIVFSKNMKLKDVDISIFENGKLKNVLKTDQKGEVIFNLNFNLNTKLHLDLTKPGRPVCENQTVLSA